MPDLDALKARAVALRDHSFTSEHDERIELVNQNVKCLAGIVSEMLGAEPAEVAEPEQQPANSDAAS